MREIVQCYHCLVRVVPNKDQTCPSCLGRIEALDTSVPYSPNIERLRLEAKKRTALGKSERWKARGLFVAAWIPIVGLWNFGFPKYALAFFLANASRNRYDVSRRIMAPNGFVLLAKDPRPPVVFLRSFRDDGAYDQNPVLENFSKLTPFYAITPRTTQEERVALATSCVGPVVAIGRPRERLPEMGAARMYVPESHWQSTVEDLLKRARLVIVRVGPSQGVAWETETAVRLVPPERIVFYLEAESDLAEFVEGKLPIPIPRAFKIKRFVYFDNNWDPQSASRIQKVLKSKRIYRIRVPKDLIVVYCVCALLLAWILFW
ncbi:MAG: hypothetical protein IT422_09050 [Pirellulaceae bacterium]|nr:hypothetical protein [Pirellulaceae bacterium]